MYIDIITYCRNDSIETLLLVQSVITQSLDLDLNAHLLSLSLDLSTHLSHDSFTQSTGLDLNTHFISVLV